MMSMRDSCGVTPSASRKERACRKLRRWVANSVSGPLAASSHEVMEVLRMSMVPHRALTNTMVPPAGVLRLWSRSWSTSPPMLRPWRRSSAPSSMYRLAASSQTALSGSTSVSGACGCAAAISERVAVPGPVTWIMPDEEAQRMVTATAGETVARRRKTTPTASRSAVPARPDGPRARWRGSGIPGTTAPPSVDDAIGIGHLLRVTWRHSL